MKRILAVLGTLLTFVVGAQEYVWNGGSSGAWSTPGNWEPNGTPGAGDTATFSATTEITDGFTIGSGTLTIDVSSGCALSLKGTIAGAGAIAKTGAGVIDLLGENTFAGGFTAGTASGSKISVSYDGLTHDCNAECGLVALGHGSGLGTGTAVIQTTLYVRGGLSVTTAIEKGWSNGRLCLGDGDDVTFMSTVKFLKNCPIRGNGNTLRFKKAVSTDSAEASVWFSNSGGSGQIVFEDDFDGANACFRCKNSSLVFMGGKNAFLQLEIYNRVSFTTANSITGNVSICLMTGTAVLDLCGCDQTLAGNSRLIFPTDGTTGYVVHSDAPAQLKITGTSESKGAFCGQFTGYAGFYCDRAGLVGITISNAVQTTRGTFSVASTCTLKLTDGARFTMLGRLELLKSNGGLTMTDSAGDLCVDELYLENTKFCHLENIGTGGKLRCRKFIYGSQYLSDGVYSKAKEQAPALDANGGIVVDSSRPLLWLGGGANWSDAANWELGAVPAAGEGALIASGTVTQDVATAALANFAIENATLVMTGWNTGITAETVTIGDGGKVTCAGAFSQEANKARVLIDCTDLTIAAGGTIDVDKAGWSCGLDNGSTTGGTNGCGPGGGTEGFGASYGGFGGHNASLPATSTLPSIKVYGSAAEPSDPGSGGYQYFKNLSASDARITNTHGGGAVRINATGTVTVNGLITANGGDVRCAGGTTVRYKYCDTAGSGGAVWITCAKFAGQGGTIRAEGGAGCDPRFPEWKFGSDKKGLDKPGGGGRIAIAYGSMQLESDVVDMTISARGGLYTGTAYPLTYATQDEFRDSAELGTVWFSDEKLLTATVGCGLSGHIVNPVGYATAGDLVCTNGWVRFAGDGVAVSVGGDFVISGACARVEVGGVAYTNDPNDVSLAGVAPGVTPCSLTVAGAMTVTDGGRFDVRASETNGTGQAWGATVSVNGDLSVGDDGVIVPWCALHNLASPRFVVGGDFKIAAGGKVTADERGASGANPSNGNVVPGAGPGHGRQFGAGSHGGAGGIALSRTGTVAPTYDDRYEPTMPGSGGGGWNYWELSANGGGVVHVSAAGNVVVDGSISANGGCPRNEFTSRDGVEYVNAGSGGTVYLWGKTFSGTGTIEAKGGDGRKLLVSEMMCAQATGGGGCVAIWTGESYLKTNLNLRKSLTPTAGAASFSGTISAAAGAHCYAYNATDADKAAVDPDQALGQSGTISYVEVREKSGLMLIVR